MSTPLCLYKYREINDWTARIFTHNELYFPCPNEFEDRSDCAIPVSFDEMTPTSLRAHLAEALRGCEISYGGCSLTATPSHRDEIITRWSTDWFTNPNVFARNAQAGLTHEVVSSKGVYCLSERPDIAQMWDKYAAKHSGICLDMSFPEVLSAARQVRYVSPLPTLNARDLSMDELADALLFTKETKWSFECEWRIIEREFPKGPHYFRVPLVKGVIFGARTPSEDIERVMGWIRSARLDIPVSRAVLSSYGGAVQIEPM